MKFAPNLADMLAPVPKGRVRVHFESSIATGFSESLVRVQHGDIRGNCYDALPEVADRYIKAGLAKRFNPDKGVITILERKGVNGVRVAHKHDAAFLAELKKAGVAHITPASSG